MGGPIQRQHDQSPTAVFVSIDHHFTEGGYGTRLRDIWAACTAAIAQLSVGQDVIAVIKGFPTPWHEQAVVLRLILVDVPHRFLNSEDDGFVFQASQTHYIYAPDSGLDLPKLQAALVDTPTVLAINLFATKADGTGYAHVWLKQPVGSQGFVRQPNPVWASRVELVQYRVQPQPTSAHIDIVLQVLEKPKPGVDYHWTFRLFGEERQIAARDIAGVHPASWQADDLIYLALDVPLADAVSPTRLRIGSYTYPEIKNVLVSIPGQPVTEGVSLPISMPR